MAHRDIVVLGASAGGIPALIDIASGLPADLPATLFVVVHFPPYAVSHLPDILSRHGPLPAVHAEDGQLMEQGTIYVAPPDRHMLVRQGWIELSHGPRENHSRPAIDPLFRSAARAYGSRVVGVVLSGALYDGSLGLMAIKGRGGAAIVQDPEDAAVASMPRSALEMVSADLVLTSHEIAPAMTTLINTEPDPDGGNGVEHGRPEMTLIISEDFAEQARNQRTDETTVFTCPDCGGVMWQEGAEKDLAFRCHVGHAYAPEIFLGEKAEEFEAALWRSLRLLKEKATLTRQMATRARERGGPSDQVRRFEEQADLDERYERSLQEILAALPNPADHPAVAVTR